MRHLMLLLGVFGVGVAQLTGSSSNDVLEEEPNGPVDFSQAEAQPDGSLCVIKTKYIEKMEKQQVKECWLQNVTSCHETYVTEFRPNQEQICEENFWKACKISFREVAYNYTLQTCMTPLVKQCDQYPQQQGGYGNSRGGNQPKLVCKTWYESSCNTTYTPDQKPQTWCSKEPRKICAPDNCKMVPGEEVCHDKNLKSTVKKPEEVCDLQPSSHCRLVTNLVPHLESQNVCREIPKEVCHLKLDHPKMVRKPVKLKWCTKPQQQQQHSYNNNNFNRYEAQASTQGYGRPTKSPVYYKPASNGYRRNQ